MDEPNPIPPAKSTPPEQTVPADAPAAADGQAAAARGSGHISEAVPQPRERSEHSVIMALPDAAKAERIAAMRRELAELQRQLIEAQQRIATELQGRADDAERFEALEARMQAQELEAEQETTRANELETEIVGLRLQIASATATAQELRRDIAARDTKIEEARGATETQASSLQETKALLETRDAELATRTTERDAAQATATKLEKELEDQRKQHGEVTEQLEVQVTSLRDAKSLVVTRDAELAVMTSERDALKAELEPARRDLDSSRAKIRDIATELVRLGQALADGADVSPAASSSEPKPAVTPTAKRAQPPPMPPPRTEQIETILEVTEEAKPTSRVRSGLLMLLGVVVGCGVTIAIMEGSSASSTAAGYPQDHGTPPAPALAAEPAPEPAMPVEAIADPTPAPVADSVVTAPSKDETAPPPTAPAETSTDGVILLPESASGHRVYVDGRIVRVKSSRAVIPCGARKVQIGSSGIEQSLDIACGGETAVPEAKRDR